MTNNENITKLYNYLKENGLTDDELTFTNFINESQENVDKIYEFSKSVGISDTLEEFREFVGAPEAKADSLQVTALSIDNIPSPPSNDYFGDAEPEKSPINIWDNPDPVKTASTNIDARTQAITEIENLNKRSKQQKLREHELRTQPLHSNPDDPELIYKFVKNGGAASDLSDSQLATGIEYAISIKPKIEKKEPKKEMTALDKYANLTMHLRNEIPTYDTSATLSSKGDAVKNALMEEVLSRKKQPIFESIEAGKNVIDDNYTYIVNEHAAYNPAVLSPIKTQNVNTGAIDSRNLINIAAQNYKKAEDILNAPSKYDDQSGFISYLKGGRDVLTNEDTYSLLAAFENPINLRYVAKKAASGVELSEEESILLTSALVLANAQYLRSDNTSNMYSAGVSSAESAAFMVQIMAGSVLTKAGAGVVSRALIKGGQKNLASLFLKSAEAGFEGVAKTGANLFRVGGGVAATATLMPSTWTGVLDDAAQFALDGKDYTALDFTRSFANNFFEVGTERIGGKYIQKGLSKVFKPINILPQKSSVGTFIGQTWNGLPAEIGEEYLVGTASMLRSFNPFMSEESNQRLREEGEYMFTQDGFLTTSAAVIGMGGPVNLVQGLAVTNDMARYNMSKNNISKLLYGVGYDKNQVKERIDRIDQSETVEDYMRELNALQNEGMIAINKNQSLSELQRNDAIVQLESDIANILKNTTLSLKATDVWNNLSEEEKQRVHTNAVKLSELDAAINSSTNSSNGRIQTVSISGQTRFVKKGNIATIQNEDGSISIDKENSDQTIIVELEDENGGKKAQQISIEKVDKLVEDIDSTEERTRQANSFLSFVASEELFPKNQIVYDSEGMMYRVIGVNQDGVVMSVSSFDENGNPITLEQTFDNESAKELFKDGFSLQAGQTIGGMEVISVDPNTGFVNLLPSDGSAIVKITFDELLHSLNSNNEARTNLSKEQALQQINDEAAGVQTEAKTETSEEVKTDEQTTQEQPSENVEEENVDPTVEEVKELEELGYPTLVDDTIADIKKKIEDLRKAKPKSKNLKDLKTELQERQKEIQALEDQLAKWEDIKLQKDETIEPEATETIEETKEEVKPQGVTLEDANKIASNLNLSDHVVFVERPEDVTNPIAAIKIALGYKVKGWFDKTTGKTFVYLPNMTDSKTIKKTLFHEIVAHKGLRRLLGEEKFKEFSLDVFNNVMGGATKERYINIALQGMAGISNKSQEEINTIAGEEATQITAAEEFIARVSEDSAAEDIGLWRKFTKQFRALLRSLGIDISLSNNDISNMLIDSYNNIQNENTEEMIVSSSEVSDMTSNLVSTLFSIQEVTDALGNVKVKPRPSETVNSHRNAGFTKIKKKFGETSARTIRSQMPSAIDYPQQAVEFLSNLIPVKSNVNDVVSKLGHILEAEFKAKYLQTIESSGKDIENKTPKEILAEVGYDLYNPTTGGDVLAFRDIYYDYTDSRGKSNVICTFNDPDYRLSGNVITFIVKEDAKDTLPAEMLTQENLSNSWKSYLKDNGRYNSETDTYDLTNLEAHREDPYSTSVLSIQLGKKHGGVKIISRYNHILDVNPDNTYDGNIDRIKDGLMDSMFNFYNIEKLKGNSFFSKIESYIDDNDLTDEIWFANIDGEFKLLSGFREQRGQLIHQDYIYDYDDNTFTIIDKGKSRLIGDFVFHKTKELQSKPDLTSMPTDISVLLYNNLEIESIEFIDNGVSLNTDIGNIKLFSDPLDKTNKLKGIEASDEAKEALLNKAGLLSTRNNYKTLDCNALSNPTMLLPKSVEALHSNSIIKIKNNDLDLSNIKIIDTSLLSIEGNNIDLSGIVKPSKLYRIILDKSNNVDLSNLIFYGNVDISNSKNINLDNIMGAGDFKILNSNNISFANLYSLDNLHFNNSFDVSMPDLEVVGNLIIRNNCEVSIPNLEEITKTLYLDNLKGPLNIPSISKAEHLTLTLCEDTPIDVKECKYLSLGGCSNITVPNVVRSERIEIDQCNNIIFPSLEYTSRLETKASSDIIFPSIMDIVEFFHDQTEFDIPSYVIMNGDVDISFTDEIMDVDPLFSIDDTEELPDQPKWDNSLSLKENATALNEWRKKKSELEELTGIQIPERPVSLRPDKPFSDAVKELSNSRSALNDAKAVARYKNQMIRATNIGIQTLQFAFDDFLQVDLMQNHLVKEGAHLDSKNNVYLAMDTTSRKIYEAQVKFNSTYKEPLMNAIGAITSYIKDRASIQLNDIIWRGFDEQGLSEKTPWIIKKTTPSEYTRRKLNGTNLTEKQLVEVYLQAKDIIEAQQLGLPDRGARGFVKHVGMSANSYIDLFEQTIPDELIKTLQDEVYNTNMFSLNYMLEAGLIDQEVIDNLSERKHYVPQRSWIEKDENGAEFGGYIDKDGNNISDTYNPALVKASGRSSMAESPIAFMLNIANSSILASEKNKTKQVFLRFVSQNEPIGVKTGAFDYAKIWFVKQSEDGEVKISNTEPSAEMKKHDKAIDEKIKELNKQYSEIINELVEATEEFNSLSEVTTEAQTAYDDKVAEIEGKINEKQSEIDVENNKKQIVGYEGLSDLESRTPGQKRQHYVNVRKNGQTYRIFLNNPRVSNAINRNFAVPPQGYRAFAAAVGSTTRIMTSMMTQYSPVFAAKNFVRDYQTSCYMTGLLYGGDYLYDYNANIGKAIGFLIYNGVTPEGKQNPATFPKLKELYDEYTSNGVQTGWSFTKPTKKLDKDVEKYIKQAEKGKLEIKDIPTFLKIAGAPAEFSENITRFAQFITAREKGLSIEEATARTKNVTVNFDRKGRLGYYTNPYYAFANAQLQGEYTLLKPYIFNPEFRRKHTIGAVSLIALGLISTLINPDDDDTYWSEWERMSNFTFGNSVKIPISQGLRKHYAVGVNLALAIQKRKTMKEAAFDASQFAIIDLLPAYADPTAIFDYNNTLNKLEFNGSSLARMITPTIGQPMVDIHANQDFAGRTIYKEPLFSNDKNKYTDISMAKDNVSSFLKDMTTSLYKISGGDPDNKIASNKGIDINPSKLEHMLSSYLSGWPDLMGDLSSLAYSGIKGDDIGLEDVPFIKDFYKPYNQNSNYYNEIFRAIEKMDFYQDYTKNSSDKDKYISDDVKELAKEYKSLNLTKSNVYKTITAINEFESREANLNTKERKKLERYKNYVDKWYNDAKEFNTKWVDMNPKFGAQ